MKRSRSLKKLHPGQREKEEERAGLTTLVSPMTSRFRRRKERSCWPLCHTLPSRGEKKTKLAPCWQWERGEDTFGRLVLNLLCQKKLKGFPCCSTGRERKPKLFRHRIRAGEDRFLNAVEKTRVPVQYRLARKKTRGSPPSRSCSGRSAHSPAVPAGGRKKQPSSWNETALEGKKRARRFSFSSPLPVEGLPPPDALPREREKTNRATFAKNSGPPYTLRKKG